MDHYFEHPINRLVWAVANDMGMEGAKLRSGMAEHVAVHV